MEIKGLTREELNKLRKAIHINLNGDDIIDLINGRCLIVKDTNTLEVNLFICHKRKRG